MTDSLVKKFSKLTIASSKKDASSKSSSNTSSPSKVIIDDVQLKNTDNIRYLAQGTYGCVFRPALFMKESDGYISKIFSNKQGLGLYDSYQEEYESLKLLKKIDKSNKFTVKQKDVFDKHGNEINTIRPSELKNIAKCSIVDARRKAAFLNIEYGGEELSEMKSIDFKTFWPRFHKLVSGIAKMNNDMIHRDIKEPNLLFTEKKFNLIDFGLMKELSMVYNFQEFQILNYSYPYFPPEFKFMAYLMNHLNFFTIYDDSKLKLLGILGSFFEKDIDLDRIYAVVESTKGDPRLKEIFDVCLENFESYPTSSSVLRDNRKRIYLEIYNFLKVFYEYFQKNYTASSKDIFENFMTEKEVKKVDVFSLGMTFAIVVRKIKDGVGSKNRYILDAIIQKMTSANVFERIEITQLSNILKHIKDNYDNIEDLDIKALLASKSQSGGRHKQLLLPPHSLNDNRPQDLKTIKKSINMIKNTAQTNNSVSSSSNRRQYSNENCKSPEISHAKKMENIKQIAARLERNQK
jgi:serine/threonine protein kinase